MASTVSVPVEAFLKIINERPTREFVDGVLLEKPMGTSLHGLLQGWLIHLLTSRFPEYAAISEWHVRLRPMEYRVPDVAVQRRAIALSEAYGLTPLVLAIEILSPGDRLAATFAKCESYHAWGVPDCWVFDPDKRRAWSYAQREEPRVVEDALVAGEIRLNVSEVFAGLD